MSVAEMILRGVFALAAVACILGACWIQAMSDMDEGFMMIIGGAVVGLALAGGAVLGPAALAAYLMQL